MRSIQVISRANIGIVLNTRCRDETGVKVFEHDQPRLRSTRRDTVFRTWSLKSFIDHRLSLVPAQVRDDAVAKSLSPLAHTKNHRPTICLSDSQLDGTK